MNFRGWFDNNFDLWEMTGIANMDTSHITFQPIDSFDEEDARTECERDAEHNFDYSDYNDGIYDEPEDDPDFSALTAEDWVLDNPKPERSDFETDEEYKEELESWQDQYDEIESDYDTAVRRWRREMSSRRNSAEEAASEAQQEYIDDCVDAARRQHGGDDDEEGLEYKFDMDGKDYTVAFVKIKEHEYEGQEIEDIYSLTFEGPRGYSLTREEGGKATKIYTQLLLAAKKFLETQKVNGLSFTPADPGMALVYKRFVSQFLPKDFIQVSSDTYLKKSIVRELTKDMTDEKKKAAYGTMIQSRRDVRDKLKNIAATKMKSRKDFIALKPFIGQVATIFDDYANVFKPVYINSLTPTANGVVADAWTLAISWGSPNLRQGTTLVTPETLATKDKADKASMDKFIELMQERNPHINVGGTTQPPAHDVLQGNLQGQPNVGWQG